MKITLEIPDTITFDQLDKKYILNNESEQVITQLIVAKKQLEEAEEQIKKVIFESMKNSDLKPKSIIGEYVKVSRRYTGGKYKIADESKANEFLKQLIRYTPDTLKIEEHIKRSNELPSGIESIERSEIITISEINND